MFLESLNMPIDKTTMQMTATHDGTEPLGVERAPVDQGRLEIWRWSSGHHALHAGRRFAAGEALHGFSASARVAAPTRHSVQIGEDAHVLLEPAFLQYTNHGCSPNVSFDVKRMEVVALGAIDTGEEILYFYPSTEWVMTHPFRCQCRAEGCLREIRGAAFLPAQFGAGIPLSEHIRSMLARRRSATSATLA
jgi:hypothetical protein